MRNLVSFFLLFSFLQTGFTQNVCWKTMSCGYQHSLALGVDSSLWACGNNQYYAIGNGTNNTAQYFQNIVPFMKDWVFIAAGNGNSIGIRANGTMWGWGFYNGGVLANVGSNSSPKQMGTASNWASACIGASYTLALKTNGSLWATGKNTYGQLGLGDYTQRNGFEQVGTATDWVKVANNIFFGNEYSFGLKSNGTLWAWGRLEFAIPSIGNVNVPTQVGTDADWKDISVGESHILALKNDSTVWVVGGSSLGALGFGTSISNVDTFTKVNSNKYVKICASSHSSAVLDANGKITRWGNNLGQANSNNFQNVFYPTMVTSTNKFTNIDMGDDFTMLIRDNGQLYSAGNNQYSQLGIGLPTAGYQYTHNLIPGCTGISAVEEEEEFSKKGMIFSPNPSNGIFHIQNLEGKEIQNVRIFDINGKTASSISISDGILDITHLSGGIYYLQIQLHSEEVMSVIKLIKF